MYDEFLKDYMIFLHRHFLNRKFFIGIPIKHWLKNLERMSEEKILVTGMFYGKIQKICQRFGRFEGKRGA